MTEDHDIQIRLAALPLKQSVPFTKLLMREQLDEETVSLILDAGELSGDHHRLLGFAIGFLHLRAKGVPVHDVIRMAKHQNTRINLGWSAKRWQLEHERLSRAEALGRLASENTQYDVSAYEKLLPQRFSGYLIRTSRRLGMEGLRQRHCVASYHDRLKAGKCAIASVFVSGQRWTVELHITGTTERSLRINQIKARYNGLPSAAVRQSIHKVLGVEVSEPNMPGVHPAGERTYMDTLRRLLPVLREHSVEDVVVEFEGSGDNGSIDTVSFFPGAIAFDPEAITIEYLVSRIYWDDGHWSREAELTQNTVHNAVEALAYDYIEETGVDWYNNDGGFGALQIDVDRGTVNLEVQVRHTQTSTEFLEERDILTGEEI